MKKDFDFDDIGKRTPYTTPDGFFEDVQRKVMERKMCIRDSAEADKKEREKIDKLNQADSVIFQTENQMCIRDRRCCV